MKSKSVRITSRKPRQAYRPARVCWACGLGVSLVTALGVFVGWPQTTIGTASRQDEAGPSVEHLQDPQDDLKLSEFMQIKLLRSQNILEGLATRDFTMIKDATKEIHALTEGAKWKALDSPAYRKLTEEFQTATERLLHAAEKENLEGVALRFYDLSTRCIDCHEHLRSVGF